MKPKLVEQGWVLFKRHVIHFVGRCIGPIVSFVIQEEIDLSDLRRKLVKLLKEGGCNYVRPAKGDHEWWYSPITGQHFSVDHSIKSFHTANGVLKQAGLPKAF